MKQLDGRVAVVTGAASGIGRSLAHAFGAKGCRVVLADVEQNALENAAKELDATGVDCIPVLTDVSDAASVDALAAAAVSTYGAVHILCNNAGVSRRGALIDQSLEDWTWMLGVNLWGVIHGLRSFLPILLQQDEAHIVNTSSSAGVLAFAMGGPYNSSKFAVVGLTETLYHELRSMNAKVGVTLLLPGPVRTGIVESGRNRPSHLARPMRERNEATVAEGLARENELSKALISSGMDPAQVAKLVVEAVETDRFYLITHPDEYGPEIEARTRRMLAGEPPEPVGLEAILGSTQAAAAGRKDT